MIKLVYKVNLNEMRVSLEEVLRVEIDGQKGMFEMLLYQALQLKLPNGLDRAKRKSVNRILGSLDTTNSDTIEIESAEFDLLKSLFCDDTLSFPANQTRIFEAYSSNIEAAIKE